MPPPSLCPLCTLRARDTVHALSTYPPLGCCTRPVEAASKLMWEGKGQPSCRHTGPWQVAGGACRAPAMHPISQPIQTRSLRPWGDGPGSNPNPSGLALDADPCPIFG